MATQLVVPALGESVSEATVATWLKKPGEAFAIDEPLVELETDKVTLEVPAPIAGSLASVTVEEGDTVGVGAVLGMIEEGSGAPAAPAAEESAAPAAEETPKAEPASDAPATPAAAKIADEKGIDTAQIDGSGKDGRVTKGDVLEAAAASKPVPQPVAAPAASAAAVVPPSRPLDEDQAGREERVKMSRLRTRIAERLKSAQNTAAMLTTWNEADMSAVMALRKDYRDQFEKAHGVRLGFMSFFVAAACKALKEIPAVNAEIQGNEIVYKNYYNIGVAVGTPNGLVVPVVKDADRLNFADTEKTINDFGRRARDGKLGVDEMQGGTFTISNGGVYGSLMSAPILNPPQSGILGMHKIEQRPVVVDGEIVIRPMMYLALSYDHRIIDGKEAVTFLVKIKEAIEDPTRLVLGV